MVDLYALYAEIDPYSLTVELDAIVRDLRRSRDGLTVQKCQDIADKLASISSRIMREERMRRQEGADQT
jgi:uncharacterized membrane protein